MCRLMMPITISSGSFFTLHHFFSLEFPCYKGLVRSFLILFVPTYFRSFELLPAIWRCFRHFFSFRSRNFSEHFFIMVYHQYRRIFTCCQFVNTLSVYHQASNENRLWNRDTRILHDIFDAKSNHQHGNEIMFVCRRLMREGLQRKRLHRK